MRQTRYYRSGVTLLVCGVAILAASLLLLRSAPGASTGIALLVLGAIMLVLGDSRPRVSPELAQLLLHAGYDNLARLLEELGLRSAAVYLPSSLCHGVPRALIPLSDKSFVPSSLAIGEDRLIARFSDAPDGVGLLVSTPGTQTLRLLPSGVGTSMDELGASVQMLTAGTLDLVQSAELHEVDGIVSVVYRGVSEDGGAPAMAVYQTLGSPLAAIAATLTAENRQRPVVIESETAGGDTLTVRLRVMA